MSNSNPNTEVVKVDNSTAKTSLSQLNFQKQTTKRSPISLFFSNIAGESKELRRYDLAVKMTLELDDQMKAMSDEDLKNQTAKFRQALEGITDKKQLERKLKELLPEAFATVQIGRASCRERVSMPV